MVAFRVVLGLAVGGASVTVPVYLDRGSAHSQAQDHAEGHHDTGCRGEHAAQGADEEEINGALGPMSEPGALDLSPMEQGVVTSSLLIGAAGSAHSQAQDHAEGHHDTGCRGEHAAQGADEEEDRA
jgi:hypothetical protein